MNDTLKSNLDYLWQCNGFLNTNPYAKKYKNIIIYDAVLLSISNLKTVLIYNEEFNAFKIYNDPDELYLITSMTFALKKITYKINLRSKYLRELQNIIFQSVINKAYNNRNMIYSYLNTMISETVSNNDLWFLRSFRDSLYNSLFSWNRNVEYFYFVSIYIFFLIEIDKDVPKQLKTELKFFLEEDAEGINSDFLSWNTLIKYASDCNETKMVELLPKILEIRNFIPNNERFYNSKKHNNLIRIDFSEKLLIRVYLEIIFNNIIDFDIKKITDIYDKLKKHQKEIFHNEVNLICEKENTDNTFLKFYKICHEERKPFNLNLFKELKKHCDIKKKDSIKDSFDVINALKMTDQEFKDKNNKIINSFKKAIEDVFEINNIENNNNLNLEPTFYYNFLIDVRYIDSEIEEYCKTFKSKIEYLPFYSDFLENIEKKEIFELDFNQYECILNRDLIFYKLDSQLRKKIEEKNELKLNAKECVFLKNNKSLNFGVECIEKESYFRALNDNEINNLIDNNYKVINGLFQYAEVVNEKYPIFLSRIELFYILKKRYCLSCLAFKTKIELKNNEAVIIARKDKD